ncbi:3-octaprenyl-4-hydroxybenzoate carboxy-lyase [Desulforamulus reducens MI-1]|uniref:Flavin prenyltransferase UbiX n=1 Tax=Desulforamulus reducens (strain ATCC BAA-1160 / DSM 100696 / MI-1) TaxID=349161 RepID=A4J7D4_DESRM|nr:UbiX family flavin prenyltransferase [Desulforamulus reducens]ABO50987.1 3-octaprenyl-4-hydroxybenzoate carboxy-lyase [Desulforamulus reducens MI-1]
MRIVVGITGATGAIYGINLLEQLKKMDIETHLILSHWARRTIELETSYSVRQVIDLANIYYPEDHLAAAISSGSFRHQGMIIAPCSMKTLAGLAHGYAENLIVRAADVTLKEGRPLILVPRETPLNAIHLENMLKLAKCGAVILPPMPAFYHRPASIQDIVDQTVGRILDRLGVENNLVKRWTE